MPNTTDYLNKLISDKNALVTNLVTKGVEASTSETFTTLVPKVLDISGGGGGTTTLPLEYLAFNPIAVTYPNPTIIKFPASLSLTAGQRVAIDFHKGNDDYTEIEEIIDLSTVSEVFGNRLGFAYASNNLQLVLINDCNDIDLSEGTVSGDTGVLLYGYGEEDYFTATIREATAEELEGGGE